MLRFACALAALVPVAAPALGPHEVLLLVNARSPASLELANHFVALRGVPAENVLFLALPDSVRSASASISREEFTRRIWDPARAALRERGLEDRVLAWVYSADFPVRVNTSPPMSLMGLTFARNVVPESGLIKTGTYANVLFRGPAGPGRPSGPSLSLENLNGALGTNMPLPSMMLGFTGARGLPAAEAVRVLEYGKVSDGSRPPGKVHFVRSAGVRSRARGWQYADAAEELRAMGVACVVSSNFPAREAGVVGVLAGRAVVNPASVASFAPGAMGEHLTSFAAVFASPDQTKLTAWLRAGATASAGTVVEPYAIWTKFPAARFFVHYAHGCTMLESFYQSIASPTQCLLVGAPLARPWAPALGFALVSLQNEPFTGEVSFFGKLFPEAAAGQAQYLFLLDGRRASGLLDEAILGLDASKLAPGYHELRGVAYLKGPVRYQATAVKGFRVAGEGRGVDLPERPAKQGADLLRPLAVTVEAEGKPASIGLLSLGRVLAETQGVTRATFSIDPSALGAGPVPLQAAARYPDGMVVRGPPHVLTFAPSNAPPVVADIERKRGTNGETVLTPKLSDPDGDAVTTAWFERLLAGPDRPPPPEAFVTGAGAEVSGGVLTFRPDVSNRYDLCVFNGAASGAYTVDVRLREKGRPAPRRETAYLVFGCRDSGAFGFFGLSGALSAWVLGECRDSNLVVRVSRGAPIRADRWYRLEVRQGGGGAIEGRVDGETVARWKAPEKRWDGPPGLLVTQKPAEFRGPARRVEANDPGVQHDGDRLILAGPGAPDPRRLLLRATDGFAETDADAR